MGFGDIAAQTPGWSTLFAEKPKPVKPAAFDPKRPNWKGYEHRPVLRIADRFSQRVWLSYEVSAAIQAHGSQEGVRAAVKPTAGGYHVDWPEGDARTTRVFTITARTGEWPRGYVDGAPDGMAEMAALREIWNLYLSGTIDRSEWRLEFFLPDEPVDKDGLGDALWEVVPQGLAPQRAAGIQDWRFTLRLEAVERLDHQGVKAFRRGRKKDKEKKKSLWDRLRDAEQFLADNSFDAWFFKYQLLLGPLVRIKQAEERLLSFVQGWNRGIHEFVGYPAALLGGMVGDYNALLAEFERDDIAEDAIRDQKRSDWRALTERRRKVVRMRNAAAVNASTTAQPLGTTGDRQGARAGGGEALPSALQAANSTLLSDQRARADRPGAGGRRNAEVSTRMVYVGPGQTLAALAPAGFTTLDILQLNPDLEWPFVDGSRRRPAGYAPGPGEGRVAYQGDAVRVPVRASSAPAAVNAEAMGATRANEDERLFGRDLLVDEETRSLVFDPATNDLQTVVGVDNLLQRLRHALVMPLGSLRSAPDVGSYLLAEDNQWATDTGNRLDAIAVRRTVQNDPGIADVGGVVIRVEDGVRNVSFEATAIGATPVGRVTFAV